MAGTCTGSWIKVASVSPDRFWLGLALGFLTPPMLVDKQAGKDGVERGLVKICGMFGVVITGVILDIFKRFKETICVIYSSCLLLLIAFTFTLDKGIITAAYLVIGLFGIFAASVYTAGYELATEITYPIPEGTSAGVMSASAQIFGILFVYLYSYLLDTLGDKTSNLTMCGMLGIATLLVVFFIRYDLKRHKVQVEAKKG
ncbi:hypothetical protein ILUMI_14916 [Ignelater luminosus]|uniref:Major facilitator superfamily (MFS) profile domain-containing protein n=1 Tax=Ignelater luminosus TaxID=2038154 RepID=A0A8K0CTY1_IGNLU|nr:hypothetical protein ILUMI_14916 [Ignelater luminosus]